MGDCYIVRRGGGGMGGLNFQIVGGTTQPSNPKENTIWVETDAEITGWAFRAKEPADPTEGMVWVLTGISSDVSFNALKKNEIAIYPIEAKQYLSGAWVPKDAYSYQNGEWQSWIFYLFNGVLGDYTPVSMQSSLQCMPVVNNGELLSSGYSSFGYYLTPSVDVTEYSILEFDIYGTAYNTNSWFGVGLSESTTWTNNATGITHRKFWSSMQTMPSTKTTQQIDISAVSGDWYFQVHGYAHTSCSFAISSIKLLK